MCVCVMAVLFKILTSICLLFSLKGKNIRYNHIAYWVVEGGVPRGGVSLIFPNVS